MTITRHDAIIKAIVAVCLTPTALAGGNVSDETTYAELPEGTSQAIEVSLLDSQPQRVAYGKVEWQTIVRVACKARDDRMGTNGRPTSQIGASVYERLRTAPTLGGLADGIDPPRISPDVNFQATRLGVLNLDFPVRHTTESRLLT
jgi:hypothetical protein